MIYTLPELCPAWCDGTHDPIIEPDDFPGGGADGWHRHAIGSFPVRQSRAGIAVSIEQYVARGGTFVTTELGEPCIELLLQSPWGEGGDCIELLPSTSTN
jgi:hypothetical protein